jgi:hypothetical protein
MITAEEPECANIFLDQNHWIYLAKDYWGKADQAKHAGVARSLLSHVESGRVRLPLNTIHLIEHLRNASEDARGRLAEVFERYSCGWFFAAWSDILPLELSRAVGQVYGQLDGGDVSVFGRGFIHGVGPQGRELLRGSVSDWDFMSKLSAAPGMMLDMLTRENEINRRRQNEEISKIGKRDASAIEKQREVRKPYLKEMHRRAQYTEYTYEFQKQLALSLSPLGKSIEEFFAMGHEKLMAFWSTVPSLDVDCELSLYRDRQWSRQVAANDTADLGHLALAVPYSRAVVVERFWKRAIVETRLGEKYGTAVYSDVRELVDALES